MTGTLETPTSQDLTPDQLLVAYRTMKTIRDFEERVHDEFAAGDIPGFVHLYAGEEASAVGVCSHLDERDAIASTHRGHGHCIARGVDPVAMMAEIYGKSTGSCRGKGGSMHIADLSKGMLGANGIVGGGPPLICGRALASKHKGDGGVAVAFFGDGASNQGTTFESLNLATIWNLPAIFVAENNGYAEATSSSWSVATDDIADRAAAFGMPGVIVDGFDFFAVHEAAGEAVARARDGGGPTPDRGQVHPLLRALRGRPAALPCRRGAQRPREPGLPQAVPRAGDRVRPAHRCPARRGRRRGRCADRPVRRGGQGRAEARSGRPAHRRLHLVLKGWGTAMARSITYREAINEALAQEMERDPSVIVMGEDNAGGQGSPGEEDAWGGVLGVTKGLYHKFPGRVLDTPISESAFIGAAVGAATGGLRPVAELMFIDFMGVCFDQIYNQAAKFRYMFGGKAVTPVVVRTMWGAGLRAAAQHSQSLLSVFTHIPGLKVVAPSNAYDAKGLLIQSIRDDDPVIFAEHKMLYDVAGDVPEESYAIPFGEANVMREGGDVTIVAIGRMVNTALDAANELAASGVQCEIIDPRTVSPLDTDTILESVENTGRLVVVDEANPRCSLATDIAATVAHDAFGSLRAPIQMVTGPHTPVPFADSLEDLFIPDAAKIAGAVKTAVDWKR